MTVISDITQTWPEAVIDIGPIQLTHHYWGIVGSIPYDGHVVLAVSPTPPSWGAPGGTTSPTTPWSGRSPTPGPP